MAATSELIASAYWPVFFVIQAVSIAAPTPTITRLENRLKMSVRSSALPKYGLVAATHAAVVDHLVNSPHFALGVR